MTKTTTDRPDRFVLMTMQALEDPVLQEDVSNSVNEMLSEIEGFDELPEAMQMEVVETCCGFYAAGYTAALRKVTQ